MMKHKRSTGNYITPCGPWDNEGKGLRNCFFLELFFSFQAGWIIQEGKGSEKEK